MSNRYFRLTLSALLVATMSTVALADAKAPAAKPDAAAADAANAPQMTIVEAVKDFGEVPKGEKLHAEFLIKNTGKSDLQILSVQPGCGCTVADFDKVIKPGETGKVRANVDTTTFAGAIAKSVAVQTNDPNLPGTSLTIKALVKPYVEALPAGYVRFNLLQGEVTKQKVTLFTEEQGSDFAITGIDVPGEWVKATFKKAADEGRKPAGTDTQPQWEVEVTYGGPTTTIGPINERVTIHTNSKHQPEYNLTLSGIVRPTYTVQPTVLNFGEVAPTDAAAERRVVIRSQNRTAPETFDVTKVESSNPLVKAVAAKTTTPGEIEVKVTVASEAKDGEISGNLTIHTNDTIKPVYTLPLKGVVKAAAANNSGAN